MTQTHPKKFEIFYKSVPIDFKRILRSLNEAPGILGLDIETAKHPDYMKHPSAGLTPQLSEIRLVQIAVDPFVYIFDMWKLDGKKRGELLVFIAERTFFSHFAQFEAAHFQHAGIENLSVHCTQVMYRMLIGATTPGAKKIGGSLAAVAQSILKYTMTKDQQTSDWNKEELDAEQIEYAGRDAATTLVLGRIMLPKLERDMPKAYKLNREMVNPLARMTRTGFYFDAKQHAPQVKGWTVDNAKRFKGLVKRYGNINFNSYKQLGNMIKAHFPKDVVQVWPRTPKGNFKTDQDTWADYSDLPGIEDLGKYKKYEKLISTYGNTLIACVNPVTKRIHSSFSLAYTETDRLSSFDPNLQNIPSKDLCVRRMFKNQYKKSVLISADFSQIEAKLLAIFSKDPEMLKIFRNNQDIYMATAANVLKVPVEKISKESFERKVGKVIVLSLGFGMGWRKLQTKIFLGLKVRMSDKEVKRLWDRYFEWLHVLHAWQKDQAKNAETTLRARTASGMIRKLADGNYYTTSMNTPIQGSAAEIMKAATIRVDRVLRKKGLKARIVCNVHDELIVESFESCSKEAARLLKKGMEIGFRDVIPDTMGIKKLVDVNVGKTWADL